MIESAKEAVLDAIIFLAVLGMTTLLPGEKVTCGGPAKAKSVQAKP